MREIFHKTFFGKISAAARHGSGPAFRPCFCSRPPPSPGVIARMADDWKRLLKTAQAEVAETIRDLPAELRPHAERLPVSYEPMPNDGLTADGLDADLLGLFVGDGIDVPESERSPLPRQIFLFLENLWDFAEADEEIFREEVRITFIHEFGHYLGLEEHELEERGLL